MRHIPKLISGSLAAVFFAGCGTSPPSSASTVDEMSSALVSAWMGVTIGSVKAERLSPPVASRLYAYVAVTLYEGLRPGMGVPHRSLAGQLNGLHPLPSPDAPVDWALAANAATRAVAAHLLAGASQDTRNALAATYEEQRAGLIAAGGASDDSEAAGSAIADAITAWADQDGYAGMRGLPYVPPVGPECWMPTGTAPPNALPVEPYWGTLRTFALPNVHQCSPPPPADYSEETGSAFEIEARAVYEAPQTPETQAIARYWADGAGSATPPGHWLQLAMGMLATAPLPEAAETIARISVAMADGFISTWSAKYIYALIRPETYIRRTIDPAWTPLITTPMFPEYTSGHSTVSSAAATTLATLYGTRAITDVPTMAGVEARSFASFEDAAREAAISRLYGGIHYPMAISNGLEQGKCISLLIRDRVFTR